MLMSAAEEPDNQSTIPSLSSPLRSLGFQRYWIGRLCAIFATQMQSVAVGWQVYELTQRPLDLGLVGLAQFLPALGLVFVTGHVTDRYDRRYVLAVCIAVEAVCALVFFWLTTTGHVSRGWIFAALVLLAIMGGCLYGIVSFVRKRVVTWTGDRLLYSDQ